MEGTITGRARATSVRRAPISPRSSIPTLQHPVLDTMEPDNVDQLVVSKTEHSSSAAHTPQEVEVLPNRTPAPRTRKGFRHWLIIFSVLLCLFLSALEFTGVSTALPTIVHDLHGDDFVWVGSAYALASTALLPVAGGMAEIFGRRETMLISQALFALGSVLCGCAKNMNWLIAARTIQGAGGGGLQALTQIVISDLVSLRERPMYNGLVGVTWGFAAATGPIVGGALADQGQWRWFFYLNIPLTGLAAILVVLFLNLKKPSGSLRGKLGRMDWVGSFLIIASSCATVIGLTWGGVQFPWASANVLVPLVLGLVGLVGFFVYEAIGAQEPIIPFTLVSNRTSLSGYLQNFIAFIVVTCSVYFLPVYYQACRGSSPTRSGVELFGLAMTCGPGAMLTSVTIVITKKYRWQLWFGWVLIVVSMGVISTLHTDSPLSQAVGFPVILGLGTGVLFSAPYFPVLAPLPVSENAHALAFFAFGRLFATVWGVSIGTAVLQTQLTHRLTKEFIAQVPGAGSIALVYSVIPIIPTLDEPLKREVQDAFAGSIAVIWQVLIGISGLGFLASLAMKGLPLHSNVDERWGMNEESKLGGGGEANAEVTASEQQ
ncbi:hypothetical protein PHLGIDRAFT_105716 [Phlebiopsis gigantea 11061_1 CR5-6]|uniref:Major facilitator superfamily (MFS) profile domain-containing protein n=1 Tax=Phlebiopsis gigantea (strain 11061_1 CR5-6) TaxID=745531 RepID=A0A0C3S8F8_PHLG1|nr:hypothetical protein PHLGIDRAFT_105716 [Phlebiopsis gigantea 11061_1 CR5-6]